MSKTLEKYLPKITPKKETRLVQAAVEIDAYERVNEFRKAMGFTWNQIIEGMFKNAAEDLKAYKKGG